MPVTAGDSWSTRQLSSLGGRGGLISCWGKGPLGVPPAAWQDPSPGDSWLSPAAAMTSQPPSLRPGAAPEPPAPRALPGAHKLPRVPRGARGVRVSVCGPHPRPQQEVGRSSPRPPGWGPTPSAAALPSFCSPYPPALRPPAKRAPSGPRRRRNRRSPYLESLAIFTKLKTSMQAAGDPERRGSDAPSQARTRSLRSPMAGGTSARPGAGAASAAGGGGRGPGRGCTWRRWLLPPSGRERRVQPRAGPRMGQLNWERGGQAARGGERPSPGWGGEAGGGRGDRSTSSQAGARGALCLLPRPPARPAAPRAEEWSRSRPPSRAHTGAPLPALQLPPGSAPRPQPRGGGDGLWLSRRPRWAPPDRRGDLAVAGTPTLPKAEQASDRGWREASAGSHRQN